MKSGQDPHDCDITHPSRDHRCCGTGLAAEQRVVVGDPKPRLLRHVEGWQADGIIVGAHGLAHGARRILCGFASAIATRAQCTVEIVRERAGASGVEPPPPASGQRDYTQP